MLPITNEFIAQDVIAIEDFEGDFLAAELLLCEPNLIKHERLLPKGVVGLGLVHSGFAEP